LVTPENVAVSLTTLIERQRPDHQPGYSFGNDERHVQADADREGAVVVGRAVLMPVTMTVVMRHL
jgi:hypothetical protein